MKIDILSDVHADFYCRELNPQNPKYIKQLLELVDMLGISKENSGDALVIAGDLSHYNHQSLDFMKICKEFYKHVLFTPGNHDYYLVSSSLQSKYHWDSWNRKLELKKLCKDNDIHYLDGQVVSLDGITFAGLGMTWDKSYYNLTEKREASNHEVQEMFRNYMNDAKLIFRDGKQNIKVPTAYGGSFLSSGFCPFKYFQEEYQKLQKFQDYDNIDVMISHYGPVVPDNIPEDYKDCSTTFYYFDGSKDIERISPKYWIFGHTHNSYDFIKGNTRLICNPVGYPSENRYTQIKRIEIE